MRNRRTRYAALLLGILVAVSIVFSHFSQFSPQPEKTKTEQAPDGKESDEEKAIVTLTSLPSHTIINFNHEVFCLFEIVFADQPATPQDPPFELPSSKFFSTLLSVIISPNAP